MSTKGANTARSSSNIDARVVIGQVISLRVVAWACLIAAALMVLLVVALSVKGTYESQASRNRQYEILRSIHIGTNQEEALGKLSPYTNLHASGSVLGMKKVLVVAREYAAEILSDSMGQIAYYSVLSCSRDFQPSFDAPDGEVVSLQSLPLSLAVSSGDTRFLHYEPGLTGSSTDQLFELPLEEGFHGKTTYTVGFNGACGPTNETGPSQPYHGDPKDAPASIWKFRQTYAANFYTELAVEGIMFMDTGSIIKVTGPGVNDFEYLDLTASIYHKDLPDEFINFRNGTRKF